MSNEKQWIPQAPEATYPKNAVNIVGWEDGIVQFATLGGSFVRTMNESEFRSAYRPTTKLERDAPYYPALFGFDEGPMFVGLTAGFKWNGWATPVMPKSIFKEWDELMTAEVGDSCFHPIEGKLYYWYEREEGDNLADYLVPEVTIKHAGQLVDCYDLNIGLCWLEDGTREIGFSKNLDDLKRMKQSVTPDEIDAYELMTAVDLRIRDLSTDTSYIPGHDVSVSLEFNSARECLGGSITSSLGNPKDGPVITAAAVDALEALVLAQACEGIDITTRAYADSFSVALAAINEKTGSITLTTEQKQAIRCAHADLTGAAQAKEQNDIHVHDWRAHNESIIDLENGFPELNLTPKNL